MFMRIVVIFMMLFSSQVFAGEFDLLIADYFRKVVRGDTASLAVSREFAKQLEEDKIEFKVCERKACTVRTRENPVLRKQQARSSLWEVRFDVYLGDKPKVRRSGCYLVEKTDRGLILNDYIYECFGK